MHPQKRVIQLFRPYYRIDETLDEIRDCLEKGWTGLGYKTVQFEEEWKKYTNLPHAHFLNSATAGLELAFKIFKETDGWENGDEIITTPLTFVSTNHAILKANLQPVFADIDEYLTLDPDSVLEHLMDRTRAVVFVGIGGNSGQYPKIRQICAQNGLKLIVDGAHMAGTRINGRHVGINSDVSIFSFHAVKNLPTADSGMICFKDPMYDHIVRKMSWLGINKGTHQRMSQKGSYKWQYDVEYVGDKAHGNSVMAAIGLVALRYLDQDNAYRRQLAKWYSEMVNNCYPFIKTIPTATNCETSQHLYQIRVDNRDDVILGLNQRGIYPGVHYIENTKYKMYGYAAKTCSNAEKASRQLLSLPLHIQISHRDVEYIVDSLIEVISKIGKEADIPIFQVDSRPI